MMLSRMMKLAVFTVAVMALALSSQAQAGSHSKCDRLTGHAAAMAKCGDVAIPSVRPLMFDEVTRTQHKLNLLGYDLGKYGVDGRLGPRTVSALRQFQRDHKLTVDGRIGVQTRTMLNYVTQQYRAFGHRM